ncbi:hypothetical protein TG4357_02531 [Thalassovita gelatinovora]|uniref:Lipoprotein n=1 Tax=Thalassovita gelatinovora TaxID=53501 RepID=A0A0P1FEQ5_THAGE|nr:DUF6778 family protein [Thalassovita gelatinovora]QIZ79665.1 hypothetical protein HFZ77_03825 [Thalassovita gelatinovora]CUH66633.1 hypothetical protein TG4357_02531 [Thalassovita gelatinovora]SEQ39469.1 hypothetical protein SAMN04488043_10567 [Thalassovita gelatinovora]
MNIIRTGLLLAIGLGLSACSSIDTASRNIPLEMPQMTAAAPVVAVADYSVKVSRSLRASEANMYYPMGDIVWRGDPMGDRHAQIAQIFQDSLTRVQINNEDGALPVVVDIDLIRFHALTEKTRYTIGGVHSINFNMTVRNPITGDVIVPTHEVKADLRGYGGSRAMAAEQQGLTQKVRITQHLANVIAQELAAPGSAPQGVTEMVAGLETQPQG